MKVFVYGSLKKGFYNNVVLGDSEFVAVDIVSGYSLISLGAFPMAIPDPEGYVIGEVYYVTPETLERLDRLEGFHIDTPYSSMYDRKVVHGEMESNMLMYAAPERVKGSSATKFEFWNKGYRYNDYL